MPVGVCDGMTRGYEVTAVDGTYRVFESSDARRDGDRSLVAVFKHVSGDVADSYMGQVPDVDGDPVVYAGCPEGTEVEVGDVSDVATGVLSALEAHDVTVIDVPVYTIEISSGSLHRFMDFSDAVPVTIDAPSEIPA